MDVARGSAAPFLARGNQLGLDDALDPCCALSSPWDRFDPLATAATPVLVVFFATASATPSRVRRKVRHVGEGDGGRRPRYLATVVSAISMPNF